MKRTFINHASVPTTMFVCRSLLAFVLLLISLGGLQAEPNPEDIYSNMLKKYAAMKTYQDSGKVVRAGVTTTFSTLFVRPQKFRLQFVFEYPARGVMQAIVIWTNGTDWSFHSHNPKSPGEDSTKKGDADYVTAAASGGSQGTSDHLIDLLSPGSVSGGLSRCKNPVLLGTKKTELGDFYEVKITDVTGAKMLVFIGANDSLVYMIRDELGTTEVHGGIKTDEVIAPDSFRDILPSSK